MLQLFTDNIEDMYNCLPKIKALFSPKHRRRLVCLAAFLMICAEISAQDATITNPSDTTGWGDSDTVSFTTSATITFPASSTITIENLIINAGDNDVTLDLNGSTLKLVRRSDWRSGRLKLGNDNAGHLIIKNGTFIADEFDTNDDLHNYLELNNANVTINQNLFVNGTGQTDITGEGTSSFIIPASYFTDYGDSNVLVFPGALQPTTATNSGGNIYTITTSGTPAPGATVTINISCKDSSSNPVDFSNITYKATITGDETYVIQETNATTDATTLNNTPASSTMQITLKIPSSVANTHGISLALYEGDSTSTLLATPVFYTQQYNETTWSGTSDTDWNKASNWNHGVPAAGMLVSIPAACLNWPLISANTNNMDSLTVEENAQLSLTDGTLSATTVTNNGTVTISGGTINGTTSNGSSDDSLIIYAGSNSSPIWGDSYQNLEIAAGASINIGTATIAGRVINKGILNISSSFTADSFSGNGTINLNGATTSLTTTNNSATTNNLVLNNTNASLKGSFEFAAFTATDASMSGKTITLDDSVTTTIKASTLSLKGAAGSSLQLAGAGTFDTSALDTEYLSIGPDVELATYTGDISEKNCEPSDGNSQTDWLKVISNGWKIKDLSSFIYTWLGTSSDWNTASNWDTGYVPPTNSRIIIPVVSASKVYPVLPDTADFPGGTLSIASGASVQLGAKNLELSGTSTPSADILTNNGTIIYTAAGRITDGTDVINDSDAVHAGKVQYASGGSGTITTCTGSFEYYDLEVLGGGWNFDGSYKIKNKLTTGTGVDGVTENCTVSSESTIQAATFDFKGSVNFTADLTLAPYDDTATFTIPSNLHEKVNTTNKKWLHLGTDTTPENIIFASPADFSYKLNLHSTATVNAEIKLRNSITATQNITGTGSLVFTGTENQTFKTNDKQFASIIENKASGNLTIEGTPTITSFTTENTAQGNIIFSDGAAITNDFIQYDGRTTVKGTITATNFSAKNLLVSADATITTAGGTQSYQNIDGIAETENLVLNATTVSLAGNIGSSKKVANLTVNAGLTVSTDADISSTTSINFAENIDATGNKLTFDSSAIKTTKSTASTITASEVVFNSNTSLSATLASSGINFDTPKISGSGATLTNTTSLTFAAEITEEPAIVNNGAISCNGAATFSGAYSGTGSLSLSGANTTFEKDVDLSGTTFSPSTGNVILSGTNTPGTAQTLKTKADGTTTFNNLTIKGNLAITESNIINNLKAENLGGNKITFTAGTTLTVSGKLTLKGSSDSSRLSLVSSSEGSPWKIKCTGTNNHEIEFADIKDSSNISENSSLSYNLFAIGSNDSGNNSNWNFPNMSYTWTGATTISGKQDDWSTATNWSPASIPGLGANVTIAVTTNHPVLTTDLDIKTTISGSNYGTIVVEDGATFDLAGYSLTATSITNNGRVRLTGATGQTITASMVNGTDSTVEYYDTGAATTNFAWDGDNGTAETGKQYANLILNQETSSNTQLTVSKELIINEAADLTGQLAVAETTTISAASNKSVSLNNASNTFTGNVILGSATTATGNITLKAASLICLADNANAASLTLESPVQPGNKITTSGNQTYNGQVQINTASVLTAPDTKQITFNGEVTGSAKLSTEGDAVAHFNGNVNALNELETQSAVINCTSLSTTGNQTYNGNVSITTAGTNGASLSSDNSIIFNGSVTGSAKIKISGDGISYFNNTVQIGSLETQTTNINCTSIETTNEGQIYNGEVIILSDVVLTAPYTKLINFKDIAHGLNGTEALQINTANSQFDGEISNLVSLTTAATATFNNNINIGTLSAQTTTINCAQITTTGNQSYNDTITLGNNLTLIASTSGKEIDFANDISASGKTLTINTPTFKNTASSDNNITAYKIVFAASTTSIQSPNAELSFTVSEIAGSDEIKLEETGSKITFIGNVNVNPKVTTATGTSFKASSGSMTFNNDVNFANNTLTANNGTIILTRGTLSGNNTFYNLKLEDSVTISGSNTITNLTADRTGGLGGKTITFAAGSEQIVNELLILKGSSDTNKLTLCSSTSGSQWKIKCTGANNHVIQYVDVQDSLNKSETGSPTAAYNLFALNSWDSGNNTNWNFPRMHYLWKTNATSTDWNTATNWVQNSIPGKGALVTIQAPADNNAKQPILTSNLDLKDTFKGTYYDGELLVSSGATLDLSGNNLTVGTITNNGLIRLTGASGQIIDSSMSNGLNSTVEYYGTVTTPTNFAWDGDNGAGTPGKQYANLILNQATSGNTELTVSEKLTINEAANLSGKLSVTETTSIKAASNKIVILNNAANTFTGNVILGTSTTSTGDITLNAGELISIADNANAVNLTVESAVQPGNKITTSGNQTYNSQVQINVDSVLTAPNNKQIIFNGELKGSAKLKTEGDAVAHFNGNVNNLGELETQTAILNCSTLSTTGNQTYNEDVTITSSNPNGVSISSSNNVNFKKRVTGTAIKIAAAQTTTFEDNVQLGSFSDTQNSGDITFKDETTINNNIALTTNGTISIESIINLQDFSHTTASSSGKTKLSGTINASNISLSATEITGGIINSTTLTTGNLTITDATINTSSTQTYNGTVNIGTNLTIQNATDVNFAQNVNGNKIIISQADNTNFNGAVNLTEFTDSASSGNISFNDGGYITTTNGITFTTTSTLSFGNDANDSFVIGAINAEKDLTHISGDTSITGTLTAATITLADTIGGPMTITNSNLLKTINNTSISYTTSFTQNGTANTILEGSFGSANGNGSASFLTSVQLNSNTTAYFANNNDTTSVTGNIVITCSDNGLSLNGQISSQENIILYKGAITSNAYISAAKDILIFGSSYSTLDTSTNIADEYAYTTPRHEEWSQPSYSETTLPDGSNLPDTYTATLTVGTNCSLTTGKNFYANGTSLTTEGASGQWLLKLPDLTNPANGFAEAYHSVVSGCKVVCNAGTSEADTDGSKARLATLECTDAGSDDTPNTNIEFDNFEIVNAYTVRDNAIRIEFNRPIRYHASTINSLKFHSASSLPDCDFSAFYSTPDCTDESELKSDITMSYFNEDDNKTYYYFYIKASAQNNANLGAWNTDATSKTAGYSEKSSDRNGVHHDTLPCLDFPRSLKNDDGTTLSFIFTDIWGQRLKNYSLRPDPLALEPAYGSDASSYEVLDKTGPVLWTLRSGQENHNAYDSSKGQESQHSYDAHNFIEFSYSEPVNFGSADTSICDINIPAFTDDTNTEINLAENIQVTDIFGAVQEDITTSQNTMTFAGLAKITATGSSLCLHTGTEGKASKYMNALYRTDEYSLRLSIAGWTDSTVADYNGNLYKNWPGYIEEASQFTGSKASAVAETNPLVCDLSGNIQIEYPVSPTEPLIFSNADNLLFTPDPDIYGQWDLSSPVFAPLRFNAKLAWSECPDTDTSEAVGNTNGSGSTLDRIEFHFFDNTPLYNSQDPAEWFTEVGWCNPGSNPTRENLKDPSYTYASDIIGGARQFDTDSKRRTSGGVRFSTKVNSAAGFLYSNNASNMNPQTPFKEGIENVHTSTTSPLFTGSSSPRHPVNDPDSLYLGIGITDSNLPVESTFSFAYSDTKAYVTDLAGNRLRSKVSKTIDRTPPSFDIVLSPVGNNEMFIIFVKQIVTDSAELRLTSNEGEVIPISEDFMSLLPDCFQIISIDQDGNYSPSEEIKIDTSVPARLIPSHTSENFTTVRLALTQNVSIENVKNLYIQLKQNSNYPETSQDPFTSNKNSNVTLIQDSLGNYMGMYSAHALSDFAINSVTPLYAYASDMQYNDENVMEGLYGQGSWAVHDWNEDQQNYGTLPYGYDTQLVAESSSSDPMRLYLSEKPDAESVASQFNEDFSTKLRIWLPEVKDGIFSALTSSNNKNYVSSDSTYLNNENSENLSFYISADTIKKWSPGDQVSFIFGLLDASGNPYRIYDSPYYDVGSGLYNLSLNNPVPLYCFRMHNPSDISTIDLWSFRLKDITNQRGGITILNNVINADLGEKTVLKVNMPTDGNLNIAVLTLDGNIITYLNKGSLSEGEHWFTWNGKNRNGTSVARGMYFIRISGSGIDETRKVMVIKD